MEKLNVKLSRKDAEAALGLAARLGVPASEAVRFALRECWEARKSLPELSSDDLKKRAMGAPGASWVDVLGFEGWYAVSSMGEVRSLPRKVATRNGRVSSRAGKVLKAFKDKDGYLKVGLRKEGRSWSKAVHRLVAEAFLGAPTAGLEVDHRNFDKVDNRPCNLRWVTRQENLAHSFKAKRNCARTCPKKAKKLTAAEADSIFRLKGLLTLSETSRQFKVSCSVVKGIWSGQGWSA